MLHGGDATRSTVGAKRARSDEGPSDASAPQALAAAVLPPAQQQRILRPSKVRAMLAMRACRGSIMIGTALSHAQMSQIVTRLAALDAPWNCPHGRPTMRHVCALPAQRR